MKIEELESMLKDPMVGKHQKRIISDVLLLAKFYNATDTDQINLAAMVAVIQKEVISD